LVNLSDRKNENTRFETLILWSQSTNNGQIYPFDPFFSVSINARPNNH
jgi:hypothetical protein